jgi:cytochrome c oxidase subunit 2
MKGERRTARATARRVGAVALALVGTSCSGAFGMPRGASEQGRDIFHLWQVFIIAAIPVAGIVYGLIAWSVIRYRRRRSEEPGALGEQFRGNVPLEVVYIVIPVLIVIGLFVVSVVVQDRVDALSPHPDLTVDVQAYQWGWRFVYVDQGVTVVSPPSGEFVPGPELVLPLGETARFVLTSNDVVHSFWVPGFLYKHDAIPGYTFRFDITPSEAGTFIGECAEFCGLNHAYMRFSVRVVAPAEFDAWVAAQRAAMGAAS